MTTRTIAVTLRAPDPEAVTALNAIRSMGIQIPPVRMDRADLWEFRLEAEERDTVVEIAERFTDIVNPNKHHWRFLEPGEEVTGSGDDLKWVGLVVRESEDSVGENWTGILKRRGFPVVSVHRKTLWLLGYLSELDDALIRKMAMDLAVSSSRSGGLLSNPVFQEVSFWT